MIPRCRQRFVFDYIAIYNVSSGFCIQLRTLNSFFLDAYLTWKANMNRSIVECGLLAWNCVECTKTNLSFNFQLDNLSSQSRRNQRMSFTKRTSATARYHVGQNSWYFCSLYSNTFSTQSYAINYKNPKMLDQTAARFWWGPAQQSLILWWLRP